MTQQDAAQAIPVLMSSRRTVMDGEVVTFATGFETRESIFGAEFRTTGPFEVSASRDAVIVHRAACTGPESVAALIAAIRFANDAMQRLEPTWRGGAASMFPSDPTECRDAVRASATAT